MAKEYRVWVTVWEYDMETGEGSLVEVANPCSYHDKKEDAIKFAKMVEEATDRLFELWMNDEEGEV